MENQEYKTRYEFPPIELLKKSCPCEMDTKELRNTALTIIQTLLNFGIRVSITGIGVGARFTRYEITPEVGTRISKIVDLSDNIKLNLAGRDIRIQAPILGKSAIGIEVLNRSPVVIKIRDIIESKEFKYFSSNLVCVIGIDYFGNKLVADLWKIQNLLIGGTTGSGKTIFLNSLIMGILYKSHPDDVRLIMIDTKYVNLSIYNGIPHLLFPVVSDANKALSALHWAIMESTERYKKFADFGVRDLKEFNKNAERNAQNDIEKLPQILIIIDDLSDLMAINKSEIEESIVRLAGMSRATGIHLVIAMQRPSTDIVTGLIKANIPSRIAFSVFSAIDSKVILDEKGAETLLGNGDMLFKPQGYSKPVRVQGAYVSDEEILNVVDYFKSQTTDAVYSVNDRKHNKAVEKEGSTFIHDEYFGEAGKFIIEHDKASIGLLQRHFRIGFNRAARIMDELWEAGVVGDEVGTKPRIILMKMEEFDRIYHSMEDIDCKNKIDNIK